MSALKAGGVVTVPGVPGEWSVWSQSAHSPGAYFVIDKTGVYDGYLIIRAKRVSGRPFPEITLLDDSNIRRATT